jgi:hypothetical protein
MSSISFITFSVSSDIIRVIYELTLQGYGGQAKEEKQENKTLVTLGTSFCQLPQSIYLLTKLHTDLTNIHPFFLPSSLQMK